MRFDEAIKEILQSTHLRLLEKLSGSTVKRWLNVELPQTQMRRIDLLAELENGELFHLELQTRNDGRIGWRLLDYRMRIEETLGREPEQLVLYVGWEPMRMAAVLERPRLRFEYTVLDVRDLDPAEFAESARIEDRILGLLFGRGDARIRALEVLREIGRMEHPERGAALAKLMVTLGLRRLHDDILREVQRMPLLSDILDNPFLKDWFEKGAAKGRVEGRADEAARFVIHLLERRFGPLPERARDKVRATPAEVLENAVDRVLEAETLEEALAFPASH